MTVPNLSNLVHDKCQILSIVVSDDKYMEEIVQSCKWWKLHDRIKQILSMMTNMN